MLLQLSVAVVLLLGVSCYDVPYTECVHNTYKAICIGTGYKLDKENKGLMEFPELLYGETCLKISKNYIQSFPKNLDDYNFLKTLDVSTNEILVLPDDLDRLKDLEILDLSRNRLPTLSPSTRFPSSLRGLLLAGNYMKTIPAGFKIPSLYVLDLSQNMFTEIPESFCVSNELIRVDFTNNSLSSGLVGNMESVLRCRNAHTIPFCLYTDYETVTCNCPTMRPLMTGEQPVCLGTSKNFHYIVCDDKSDDAWKSRKLYNISGETVGNTCGLGAYQSGSTVLTASGVVSFLALMIGGVFFST